MTHFAFLYRPFPYLHHRRYILFWVLELLLLVTLFEYAVEPFARNYDEHLYDYWIICLFHAGVVSLCYLAGAMVLALMQPSQWRLRDELLFVMALLLLIGVGNYWVRILIYHPTYQGWDFLGIEILHAYIAGGIFYLLVIQLNRSLIGIYRSLRVKKSTVHIQAAVSADSLSVRPDRILCIKSDGNYAIFYLREEDGVTKRMVRQTLDSVEQQLRPYRSFLRTHRAYIVNREHVRSHRGNAAGYQLSLPGLDFTVPVSRTHVKKWDDQMMEN